MQAEPMPGAAGSAGRTAGVLLHPSSLPSAYGAGDLGHAAYRFVEFLAAAGFGLWQLLPLGPPHEDGSPYHLLSVHAGNPRLISLDWLVDRGWLERTDLEGVRSDTSTRCAVLQVAAARFRCAVQRDQELDARYRAFCAAQTYWLQPYAHFVALREAAGGRPWYCWEPALRDAHAATVEAAIAPLGERIDGLCFEQYVFAQQWQELRAYASERGVRLFGDLPIFVAHDSADVWSCREQFRLDAAGLPQVVTGVPPDYFSAQGQRWGNPHYDWERMAQDGFEWWRQRIATERQRFDLLRIDHFRGFEACWEIARDAPDAVNGRWVPAPGRELLAVLLAQSGAGTLVAENLGLITPAVEALRREFGLPGMLILQFGFDGDPANPYLPHNHDVSNVVYTGTHDNNTTRGWFEALDEKQRELVLEYLGWPAEPMPWPLVRAALASVASLAVIPLQDLLALDGAHRMNQPGVAQGNWRWQFADGQLDEALVARLRNLLQRYGRLLVGEGRRD